MKKILFLLSVLALQSCEYIVDLDGFDKNPRLYVLGMPGESDTTVVMLRPTIPMGDKNAPEVSLDDAEVILTVNGEQVPLSVADESTPDLPSGSRYTLHPVLPGDELEFRASVDGVQPVMTECKVPDAFPEYEIMLDTEEKVVNGNLKTYLNITVDIKGAQETDDCYAMKVYRETDTFGYDAGNSKKYNFMYPKIAGANDYDYPIYQFPLLVNYGGGIDIFSDKYAPMLVFQDNMSAEWNHRLEFVTEYVGDSIYSDNYYNNGAEYGLRYRYKIFLYRLSPELLRFIKANLVQTDNVTILFAMAPPSYVYTNIRGGVGIFGGITRTETEWLPNVAR